METWQSRIIEELMCGRQRDLEEWIEDAIRHAVAAEREACAKIAQSMPRSWKSNAPDPQTRIAEAIRARGKADA